MIELVSDDPWLNSKTFIIKRRGWETKFSNKKQRASQVSSQLQNSTKHQAILEGDMLFDQPLLK